MSHDFDYLNDRLFANIEYWVQKWLSDGEKEGHYWVALNPNRQDNRLGSFKVNLKSGWWADYALSDVSGTDLISLYAYLFTDNNQYKALKILNAEIGLEKDFSSITAVKILNKKNNSSTTYDELVRKGKSICLPVPEDAPPPLQTYKIGDEYIALVDENKNPIVRSKLLRTYYYKNEFNQLMMIEYRFEFDDNRRKEVRYATCWRGKFNEKPTWEKCCINEERPLYNLEMLAKYTEKVVLVLEGAKKVEAVKWQFSEIYTDIAEWPYIPVSWCGGCRAIGKTDFEPLKGRQVIYWPDNDESGKNAMRSIKLNYHGLILNIMHDDYPNTWDVVDLIKAGGKVYPFVEKRIETTQQRTAEAKAPLEIFTHIDAKYKLSNTQENLEALLKYYQHDISFNVITGSFDCMIDGKVLKSQGHLRTFYASVISKCNYNKLHVNNEVLNIYLDAISIRNKRNPVKDWIHSERWDRKNRISEVCNAIVTFESDDYLKNILITKWLISAYAAAVREDGDGFRTRGVLVFQGNQEAGKSTFFRELVGGHLDWFANGLTLNAEQKDSLLIANSVWIAELGEIENTTKRNLPALKAYLTNNKTEVRLPYAKKHETIWRRTVYCGDANNPEFLFDETGNTRFWCISVKQISSIKEINMQQMWAEVRVLYENAVAKQDNYIWWLSPKEMELLNESNSKFEVSDSIDDLIRSRLDWKTDSSFWRGRTVTDILMECGIREPSVSQKKKAGHLLRILLKLEKAPKKDNYGAIYYKVPSVRDNYDQQTHVGGDDD